MEVRIERMVNVWDDQIPMLLINLVNTAVFARDGSEFKTAIRQLSESTDLDKYFSYGYGRNHFWLKQRLVSDTSKHMENRLLIVEF